MLLKPRPSLFIGLSILAVSSLSLFFFGNCAPLRNDWGSVVESPSLVDTTSLHHIDIDHEIEKKIIQASFEPILIDRILTSRILEKIFGVSNIQTIRNNVLLKATAFAGGCSIYNNYAIEIRTTAAGGRNPIAADTTAGCDQSSNGQIGMGLGANVSRQGWVIQTCDVLTAADSSLNFALNQIAPISAGTYPEINEPNVKKLIQLFYFDKPEPPISLIESLVVLMESEATPVAAWRAAVFATCTSSNWQVL